MKSVYLLPFLIALTLSAHSQNRINTDTATLNNYLQIIQQKKAFTGEILIAEGMQIRYQKTIGLASYEHKTKIPKEAKYRIASISKTFTGTLIAIAQEEEKLHIQDKASTYLKNLSPKFGDITIGQLLSHTSGLPHNEGIKDYWTIKSKLQLTAEQVLKEINALELIFEPGSKMHYSSLGYYLLSQILETVYKNDFETILQEKILRKLQMNNTGVVKDLEIVPQMASGYHLLSDDSLIVAPYRNYSLLKGAGDMYSTAADLLKWNNSFQTNTLLLDQTIEVMADQQRSEKSYDDYRYGWYIDAKTPKKQYHGGGTWGYSTYTAWYPENKLSIIILSNVSVIPIASLVEDIEKILFGQPFEMPSVETTSEEAIDPDVYSGNFVAANNNMVLVIHKVAGNLYAKLGKNPAFEIYAKTKDQFYAKKIEIEFTFEFTDGHITDVHARRAGQVYHFKKSR